MGEGASKIGYYYWQREGEAPGGQVDSDSDRSEDGSPRKSAARPTDTVIIFDWDDTLLCSTAINAQQWSPLQLRQLESTVEAILQTAMRLGETMIVTNGNSTWVQDSTRRFFPNLQPTLDKIKVTSARAGYEQSYPGDPFSWKRAAFKDILECRGRKAAGGINLVVLGDSPAEIEAARNASTLLGSHSLVKTVKFKECPSVDELLGQLRRVLQELGDIVSQNRNVSKGLVMRQAQAQHLSSWASGWKFSEPDEPRRFDNLSWLLSALA